MSNSRTVSFTLDLDNPPPLTAEQKAMLEELKNMPDEEIDFSDIPPQDFSGCLPVNALRPIGGNMRPPPRPNPAATARQFVVGNREGNGQVFGAAGRVGGRGQEG